MSKLLKPECPEVYEDKPLCRKARIRSSWVECTVLTDTNFGERECPFYKTQEQYIRELEKETEDVRRKATTT